MRLIGKLRLCVGLFQMRQRVVGRGAGVVAEDDSAVVVNQEKGNFLIQ